MVALPVKVAVIVPLAVVPPEITAVGAVVKPEPADVTVMPVTVPLVPPERMAPVAMSIAIADGSPAATAES